MKHTTDHDGDEYIDFGWLDVAVAIAVVALAYFFAGYFG